MSNDISNVEFNSEQIQSDDAIHTNLEVSLQAAPSSAVEAGLNDSDASRKSARTEKLITVKISSLREIELPGLPSALTGTRHDALKASVSIFGVLQPIVIDEQNVILCGRSRVNACRELGISEIKALRVSSKDGQRIARAAEVKRQLSPLEMAGTVLFYHDSDELEARKKKEPKVKTNHHLSFLLKEELGWVRCTSTRQVTGYLKLARSYPNLQSQKEKAAIEAAATLNEALKFLPREGKKKGKQDPSLKLLRTLFRFEKALEAMGKADVVKDAIETIRSAVAKVTNLNA
jgi:hypothetical protein